MTSFKQGLYFQQIGFNIHDVMIYQKKNTPFMRSNAYTNCYEVYVRSQQRQTDNIQTAQSANRAQWV